MDNNLRIRAWLRTVDEDIRAIRACLGAYEPAIASAAYHCQQAAEKLVKTLIAATGDDPPKIHDIEALIERLPNGHPLEARLRPFMELSALLHATRYPGPSPFMEPDIPSPGEVASWLAEIESVRAAVERFLAP